MKRSGLLTCGLVLLACVAHGCGGAGARPRPAPGRAALVVTVRAEPKSGYRDTTGQSGAYEVGAVGAGRVYETIDYRALDDIVVWVEPAGAAEAPAPAQLLAIDVGRPSGALRVSGLNEPWTIRNSAPEPLPVYARYESGDVVDIGTVAPGATAAHQPKEPGLVEILSDPRPDALARVYVAPVPSTGGGRLARVVRSGAKEAFNDLPPGPARVHAWHPRLPGSSATVTLRAGATTGANLAVGVNRLPKVP